MNTLNENAESQAEQGNNSIKAVLDY